MNNIGSKIAKSLAALVFLGVGFLLTQWGHHSVWHQKITLEVQTPSGLVSGSSVLKYDYSDTFDRSFGKNLSRLGLWGEVPFVDLGQGKILFAASLYQPFLPLFSYAKHLKLNATKKRDLVAGIKSEPNKIDVKPAELPLFFTFGDINDPATLRQVDPNHLNRAFGKGYHFRGMTIQTTDEPLSSGKIDKLIPWLRTKGGKYNPDHAAIDKRGEVLSNFGWTSLVRFRQCLIETHIIDNLTLGRISRGIQCRMQMYN